MSDIVTHTNATAAGFPNQPPRRPSIGKIMDAALAPLRMRLQWITPYRVACNAENRLAQRDEHGKLTALERAKTRDERFQLHCKANEVLEELPPRHEIVDAFKTVE